MLHTAVLRERTVRGPTGPHAAPLLPPVGQSGTPVCSRMTSASLWGPRKIPELGGRWGGNLGQSSDSWLLRPLPVPDDPWVKVGRGSQLGNRAEECQSHSRIGTRERVDASKTVGVHSDDPAQGSRRAHRDRKIGYLSQRCWGVSAAHRAGHFSNTKFPSWSVPGACHRTAREGKASQRR